MGRLVLSACVVVAFACVGCAAWEAGLGPSSGAFPYGLTRSKTAFFTVAATDALATSWCPAAFDATNGTRLWQSSSAGCVMGTSVPGAATAPVLITYRAEETASKEQLLVAGNGTLVALNPTTGALQWSIALPTQSGTPLSLFAPRASRHVYVVFPPYTAQSFVTDSIVLCVDTVAAAVAWQLNFSSFAPASSCLANGTSAISILGTDKHMVLAATCFNERSVYGFDVTGGTVPAKTQQGTPAWVSSFPAVNTSTNVQVYPTDDATCVLTLVDDHIACLDRLNGQRLWRSGGGGGAAGAIYGATFARDAANDRAYVLLQYSSGSNIHVRVLNVTSGVTVVDQELAEGFYDQSVCNGVVYGNALYYITTKPTFPIWLALMVRDLAGQHAVVAVNTTGNFAFGPSKMQATHGTIAIIATPLNATQQLTGIAVSHMGA